MHQNTIESFNAAEITLTQPAANRLQAVMKGESKEGFALRLEVVGGGCSGMSYKMTFEDKQKEFDKVFESQGMRIFCDLQSWLYLKGIEIDYSDDLLTGGFKIKNPNAQRTCGCGTSFSA
jgi:iron-sulfur cluster assembly protein